MSQNLSVQETDPRCPLNSRLKRTSHKIALSQPQNIQCQFTALNSTLDYLVCLACVRTTAQQAGCRRSNLSPLISHGSDLITHNYPSNSSLSRYVLVMLGHDFYLPNTADSVMDRVKNMPNVLQIHLKALRHIMTFCIWQTQQRVSTLFVGLSFIKTKDLTWC